MTKLYQVDGKGYTTIKVEISIGGGSSITDPIKFSFRTTLKDALELAGRINRVIHRWLDAGGALSHDQETQTKNLPTKKEATK